MNLASPATALSPAVRRLIGSLGCQGEEQDHEDGVTVETVDLVEKESETSLGGTYNRNNAPRDDDAGDRPFVSSNGALDLDRIAALFPASDDSAEYFQAAVRVLAPVFAQCQGVLSALSSERIESVLMPRLKWTQSQKLVSFILIGVAAYGRAAAVVTSLTLVGSLIACGVFLLIISLVGLVGAAKHHQVLLFFYMIILFLLFLLQFALACACLAVNGEQKDALAEEGWRLASTDTRRDVQRQFNCCGFQNPDLGLNESLGHPACRKVAQCCDSSDAHCCLLNSSNTTEMGHCPCDTCQSKMKPIIYNAFTATGGVGLFFSFTEIIGVWFTIRFRNQKDPSLKSSAFL